MDPSTASSKPSLDDHGAVHINPASPTPIVREPIAIVGMAAKFPGAPDANKLWTLLEKGLNTVSEIPASRFNVSDYTQGKHGKSRTLNTRFGNFLDDADVFDHQFFRVSPREARTMSPQQRLLLHVAYHALEDAGYVPGATPCFDPDTFATYIGAATNDYVQNLQDDIDVYYSTGTLQAFLSGKISYAFKFSGPSVVVDTSCSASMVAIYQACRALTSGDCNAALAGGVNVITSPDMYLGLDRAHFLSSTGQCKPWDASADGYCRAEGCGLFVLKRLRDALAENDRVLGVIRAVEVNQSAHAASITQPHVPTQIALFRRTLAAARVDPAQISVVEAHGTGTKAGDPAELESLRTVLAAARTPDNPLYITSIKANLGHAEAASGAASLAKLLLMLRHAVVPRVVSLRTPSPRLPPLGAATVLPTAHTPWRAPRDGSPRTALLSNFGAAGSNAALVLQEHVPGARPGGDGGSGGAPALVLGLAADSGAALEARRRACLAMLARTGDARALADAAYTATARRQQHRVRLAGAGATRDELCAALARAVPVSVDGGAPGSTVWVFSGQGAQYRGMGRALYRSVPRVRALVDRCDARLRAWGYPGVRAVVDGDGDGEGDGDGDARAMQPAVFVLECALAELWRGWGVRPDAVVGHSLGEYAALVAAGVLGLDDALRLVAGRAALMYERCALHESGMLAVKVPHDELQRLLASAPSYGGLSVACYNSAEDAVVAGKLDQLDALQAELKTAGRKCTRLDVPFAYHTAAMQPVLDDVAALAASVALRAPSLPVVSNVHGTVVQPGDASVFTPRYFARHCGEPVRFAQGVAALLGAPAAAGTALLVELGPHPTCLPLLRAAAPRALLLPSLRRRAADWAVLCGALAQLYTSAAAVDWRAVFADLAPHARPTELPAYPFAETRFWVAYTDRRAPARAAAAAAAAPPPPLPVPTRFSLLAACLDVPPPGAAEPARFETPVGALAHLVEGHKVAGHALCPASVYAEMASAAAQLVLERHGRTTADSAIALEDVAFPRPLVYTPDVPRTVRVEVALCAPGGRHTGRFTVSSCAPGAGTRQVHCSGGFRLASKRDVASEFHAVAAIVDRRRELVAQSPHAETLSTRTAYDLVFSRVVAYGPAYHTMRSITLDANGVDAYAVARLPAAAGTGAFVAHPVFMDTLLHAAGFVANCSAGAGEAFICSAVGAVQVLPELVRADRTYGVYCAAGVAADGGASAEAYALDLESGRIVAAMKRMQFRKLRLRAFEAVLAAAARRHPPAAPAARPAHQPGASCAPAAPVSTSAAVKAVVAAVLGVPAADIAEDDELERLGLDSLTAIEAHHALCAALAVPLPEKLFAACKTVRDVCAAVAARGAPRAGAPGASSPQVSERTLHDQGSAADGARSGAMLATVQNVLAPVLGVALEDLGEDRPLDGLGMDSLMAIEARHALAQAVGDDLPEHLFATCRTVRAVVDALAPVQAVLPCATSTDSETTCVDELPASPAAEAVKGDDGAGVHSSVSPVAGEITDHWPPEREPHLPALEQPCTFGIEVNPVLLQDGGGSREPPLFLIHDGSGVAHPYSRLSSLGRQVWGIHNPRFPHGGRWEGGLLEMASHYAGLVQEKLAGRSRCILGGWSVGGVIAFEVARQLIAHGVDVPGLVLIDAPHPGTRAPLSTGALDAVFAARRSSPASRLARASIQHASAALVDYDPSASPASHVVPQAAVMLRSSEPFVIEDGDGASESRVFLEARADPAASVCGWVDLLGTEVPVLDIPGHHFEAFAPHIVGEVSTRLNEALQML